MMHQLTISDRCRGMALCHACEAVAPGIVNHCQRHGRVLLSGPSTGAHGDTISRLLQACPERAIHLKPLEEDT